MATIERFKTVLKNGKLASAETGAIVELTAQMKYDYLAAVHTMEQIEDLNDAIKERIEKREALKSKIIASSRNTLKNLIEDENSLKEIKNIDHALRVLNECRTELLKMEGQTHEAQKLGKITEDGVSAGR